MPTSKKYRFILFDVDDTLLDFEKAEELSFFETMKSFDISSDDEMYKSYTKINRSLWLLLEKERITKNELLARRFDEFAKLFNINVPGVELNSLFLKNLGEKAILFPDSFEVCRKLSFTHKLYMITNAVANVHYSRMKNCPISRFFSGMFISEEVGYTKPGVKFFEAVANGIEGFEKESAIVVGDSPTSDLVGANAYEIDCCYLNRRGKTLPDNIKANYTVNSLYEFYNTVIQQNNT